MLKSQQERIVDATAAIVAEKGLAGLTIPEIARRASVSNKTFYEIYPSKHDAFLGAQKVGMHQALRIAVEAYEERMPDWPRAVAAGLRALIDYLVSEPDHAHLSIVDTFGASPETIVIRDEILRGFAALPAAAATSSRPTGSRCRRWPPRLSSAACGRCSTTTSQSGRLAELPAAAPQLTFMLLVPFLGPERAAAAALLGP